MITAGETPKPVIQRRNPIGQEQFLLWRPCSDCHGWVQLTDCPGCDGEGGYYEKLEVPPWSLTVD